MLDTEWRSAGRSSRDFSEEQDRAAGGRERRRVVTSDGRHVHASVVLKKPSNRLYAYIRYSIDGRTWTKYVGDVSAAQDRPDALRIAWRKVLADKNLLRHGG